jgi:hypothetical protein
MKFAASHKTRRFITLFTEDRHRSLSISILISSSRLRLYLSSATHIHSLPLVASEPADCSKIAQPLESTYTGLTLVSFQDIFDKGGILLIPLTSSFSYELQTLNCLKVVACISFVTKSIVWARHMGQITECYISRRRVIASEKCEWIWASKCRKLFGKPLQYYNTGPFSIQTLITVICGIKFHNEVGSWSRWTMPIWSSQLSKHIKPVQILYLNYSDSQKLNVTESVNCIIQLETKKFTLEKMYLQLTLLNRVLQKLMVILSRNSTPFMKPKCSLPRSQTSAIRPIMSHINPVHNLHPIFNTHFNINLYLLLCLASGLFPSGFLNKILYRPTFLNSPVVLHFLPISSRFDHPKNIWWKIQIMKRLIVQFPPAFSSFLSLR